VFSDVEGAKAALRGLLAKALLAWGDAAPIKLSEQEERWDFEIEIVREDNCDPTGCVLASAFFPDGGRHRLRLYPKLFSQTLDDAVRTLVHEIGHTFGLRHFFALVSETAVPALVYGEHKPFSIMNYGDESVLTEADKLDLKRLYELVWSGELREINGTPIKQVRPFSKLP
jgi:hypothetical protein